MQYTVHLSKLQVCTKRFFNYKEKLPYIISLFCFLGWPFLLVTRAHPIQLQMGVPNIKFFHPRGMCNTTVGFHGKSKEMKSKLIQREYTSQWIDEAYGALLSKLALFQKNDRRERNFSAKFKMVYSTQPKK